MSISKSKIQILTLFLLSTLAFAIRGPEPVTTPSSDIIALLTGHGLPPGLFPDSVSVFKAENDGRVSVTLNDDCYVKLKKSNLLLHYETTVTAVIKFGKISEIIGVQMQQPSNWAQVTEMRYSIVDDNMQLCPGPLTPVPVPISDFSSAPACVTFLNDWNSKIRSVTDAKV